MTCDVPTWQVITITLGTMSCGFVSGAALFYGIGRRHGIEVMAAKYKEWYRGFENPINKIAADAGAKVRGTTTTKDRSP